MAGMMKREDRQALDTWVQYFTALLEEAGIDPGESPEEQRRRIRRLEADPEAWMAYYFSGYYRCEPAPFHRRATKRLLEHKRWMEVRAWARELAKSARSMMEVTYLALTGEIHNMLLVSTSLDSAKRLLTPLRITLERSSRIRHDYGDQTAGGLWTEEHFRTTGGVSFLALGAGQSPRGNRNEAYRPDFILVDDIDTDEETRNPDRIKEKWQWVERALIPTLSVSGSYRVLINGNIIARDCIIKRAMKVADHVDVINIRDKEGRSVWPEKNSEEAIDHFFEMMSTAAVQQEFFNNPISEGEVFDEITWGDCPPLSQLPFAVCYGDPSPSNSRSRQSSYKAVFLVGFRGGKYYIYTGYLAQETNDRYVEWYYDLRDYVGGKCPVYYMTENNALQDPFWEQVLLPLFLKHGETRGMLAISPDTRAKMDKYARIEGALEPLNRQGRLVFNVRERDNLNMQRLEDQFKLIAPRLPAPADGPDCIEGAVWQINQRLQTVRDDAIVIGSRSKNSKRW